MVTPIAPEINLLLQLGILRYSLCNSDATFGQQLLNIRYDNLTSFKKTLYLVLSSLDYVKTRCELWRPSHEVNKLIFKCYVAFKMMDFVNTSVFLRRAAKPLLVERIMGLDQVYASDTPRTFESKYLARELLWNGFIVSL